MFSKTHRIKAVRRFSSLHNGGKSIKESQAIVEQEFGIGKSTLKRWFGEGKPKKEYNLPMK